VNRQRNPAASFPPPSSYSHGVEVAAGARMLFTAGQVGRRVDGSIADDFDTQARLAWRNVVNVLEASDMSMADVVKLNFLLTDAAHLPAFRPIWDEFVGVHRPAATIQIVHALGRPDLLVEIEAVAAK
jgi:enamine deaminase RidA (YjgF/YER057c/UK114 family)